MIKEILRLRDAGLSKRKISLALGISRSTVDKYLAGGAEPKDRPYSAPWASNIDWAKVGEATNRGEALQHFWEKSALPATVPYSSFWREYRRRFPSIPLDYHKVYRPGERCEVDFKGRDANFGYFDLHQKKFIQCRLFGAVCCFSQLFFGRATLSEKQGDWLESISKAYQYFGGVPLTTVVDNAKALVGKSHTYDPDMNREFGYFCEHYGTAPIACRPVKPKDKSVIENALGVFWRWARHRLTSHTYFSLTELNSALIEALDEFNQRIQRKYGRSRRERFEAAEKNEILPLPSRSYVTAEWQTAKVHPDSHIQVQRNFYSVPHELRGQQVDVRRSKSCIEIFQNTRLVSMHLRDLSSSSGRYTTRSEHLPPSQKAINEATPQNALQEAASIGSSTLEVINKLIVESRHPLMYLRRAQGILRLAKRYSPSSLEQACKTVLSIGTEQARLRDIEAVIKKDLQFPRTNMDPICRQPNRFLRGQQTWSTDRLTHSIGDVNDSRINSTTNDGTATYRDA